LSKESKVESAKREGRHLRGTIVEQLHDGGSHFEGDDVTLLKFHGTYQQDDRDARKRRDESEEKAFAFMVREREPVMLAGPLAVLGPGRGRWTLEDLSLRGVPFPRPMVRQLAQRMAGADSTGGLFVPLPREVVDIKIRPTGVIVYRTRR